MTTLIRATGITFTNPNLPTVSPMVTTGLIAAFRPNNTQNGLADLSGNNHKINIGGATLTDKAISGDAWHIATTDVPETRNLTILAVLKAYRSPNNNFQSFAISSANFASDAKNNYGSSIFIEQRNDNNSLAVLASGQSFADKSGTPNNHLMGGADANGLATNVGETPYIFTALVIDADKNMMATYNPKNSAQPLSIFDANANGESFANRTLVNPVNGLPINFQLFSSISQTDWGSRVDIAEVLFFDRALLAAEIMQQYQYTKDFMQKHRGIAI